jgi:ATP-binding cassette subfamily G (WHITE) protein 2
VSRTLAALHLSARADCLIGDAFLRGLSGGERRRVSVATELLALSAGGCGLVLLDEPLSGLDSANATLLTNALRELTAGSAAATPAHTRAAVALPSATPPKPAAAAAGGGVLPTPTIVMTVHQPTHRLLESISGIVVMATGGAMLYCGPRRLADGSGRCAISSHFDGEGLNLSELSGNPAEALLEAMGDPEPRTQRRLERIAQQHAEQTLLGLEARERGTTIFEPTAADGRRTWVGWAGGGGGPAWRSGRTASGFLTQMWMLCARHARLVVRHPLALWMQLITTGAISVLLGVVFWQLDDHFATGVLTRIGLIFFLGLYFMLTALVPLPLWSQDRLLYFQESAAGCYGPVAYVLSRFAYDGLMQRILPALLCAAIVYPMAGLSAAGPSGPARTALFVSALCASNLLGTAVTSCLAIVCASPALATLLSVVFVLLSTLFCGFVVNLPTLEARAAALGASWARPQFLSFLFYLSELTVSDEMLGSTVIIDVKLDGVKKTVEQPIAGEEILAHLGYALNCSRVGGDPNLACWYDVAAPFVAVIFFVTTAVMLLAFCVRDPH